MIHKNDILCTSPSPNCKYKDHLQKSLTRIFPRAEAAYERIQNLQTPDIIANLETHKQLITNNQGHIKKIQKKDLTIDEMKFQPLIIRQ